MAAWAGVAECGIGRRFEVDVVDGEIAAVERRDGGKDGLGGRFGLGGVVVLGWFLIGFLSGLSVFHVDVAIRVFVGQSCFSAGDETLSGGFVGFGQDALPACDGGLHDLGIHHGIGMDVIGATHVHLASSGKRGVEATTDSQ